VEALRLQTVADLLGSVDERVELIDGEIIRRPMARALVAYALDDGYYRISATVTEPAKVRVPPFEELALDLGYILGD